jgi:hypothetical protein
LMWIKGPFRSEERYDRNSARIGKHQRETSMPAAGITAYAIVGA